MPGMMDTVLNLGLNDETVRRPGQASAATRASPMTATAASSRCTATSCSTSSITISRTCSRTSRSDRGVKLDTELDRRRLAGSWSSGYKEDRRAASSASPSRRMSHEQLWGAIGAVFGSLDEPARHHLPPPARHPGRAGAPPSTSRRWCSATWARTAPPASPSPATPPPARTPFYGEYLVNAQGEDVVAGIRTPQPLTDRRQAGAASPTLPAMEEVMPEVLPAARRGASSGSKPLPRHAGHRVHRPAAASSTCCRPATASAPPRPRCKIAVDMVARRLIDQQGGDAAHRPGLARPAAAPDARSEGASASVIAKRPAGLARRRLGQGRVHRRRRRDAGAATARTSSWSASRPPPKTSTACTPPKAS